jgi:hypothetical protein
MESSKPDTSMTNDVLHIPAESKLSAEAIAKAVAHHNKHRGGGRQSPTQVRSRAARNQSSTVTSLERGCRRGSMGGTTSGSVRV